MRHNIVVMRMQMPPQILLPRMQHQRERGGAAEPLNSHLVRVRGLHQRDLAEGYGEVHMPFALARKYPKAGRSWIWQ